MDEPPVDTLLETLRPRIAQIHRQGWALIGGIVLVAFGLLSMFPITGDTPLNGPLFVIAAGIIAIPFIFDWVRRQKTGAVMPGLAEAAGLDYRQDGAGFLIDIPPRLLPSGPRRTAEDHVSGDLTGRRVELAEVKIETGGKNSTVLFKGFVVKFPNVVQMPAFFIAPERQTKGWFVFAPNIKVDDLIHHRTIEANGQRYGVWISPAGQAKAHPARDRVVDALVRMDQSLGRDMSLFSATSDGAKMHIALSNPRDLFRVGGLLTPPSALADQLGGAMADLSIPLKAAETLLALEASTLADQPGA